ncbi:MAG TPA: HD domain-containing protein [Longimicrobium sp.]|nr:HD domain-containing protein [Longimicrobium sp.]
METHGVEQLLEFLRLAGRLKETARAGWKLRGISEPESVAEHTFRVSLMALVMGRDAGVDRDRCVALALVHDLGECIVGDITPHDRVTPDEKRRRERDAMLQLSELAGDPEILALWEEYDAGASPEARFVRELDKLETVVQASEYETERSADVEEFWEMGDRTLQSPRARAFLGALSGRRKKR